MIQMAKGIPFLIKKRDIYYLQKRVPKKLIPTIGREFVRLSLRTKDKATAIRTAGPILAALERDWHYQLFAIPVGTNVIDHFGSNDIGKPTLTEAAASYIEMKGKAGVFARGSKMFENTNWIANTTRGTNDYIHCSHLIYLYDKHLNKFVARWLNDESRRFDNAHALTELIQWVWRSRIRIGEPITLYLPASRMGGIFIDWLEGWDSKGNVSVEIVRISLQPEISRVLLVYHLAPLNEC